MGFFKFGKKWKTKNVTKILQEYDIYITKQNFY